MAKFITPILSSEKELHTIIKSHLDSLELGLELLEYEKFLPKGIPDFLCVDSGGRVLAP
jgi:RecB family endonuclease NucS